METAEYEKWSFPLETALICLKINPKQMDKFITSRGILNNIKNGN